MTPTEIREARQSLGLTQKQFGEMLHSTARAARAWESGFRNMPASTEELLKIKIKEKRKMSLVYGVILMDCRGAKDEDKREAETVYAATLDKIFGSEEAVKVAYQRYLELFNKYEETPLPEEATDEERAAIEKWEDADREAHTEAAKNWLYGMPDSAHFEIRI